jgi:hypothetical protein
MRKSTVSVLFAFLAFSVSTRSQNKSDTVAVFVTGSDDAAPVAQFLIKKLNQSKPFEAVTKEDPSKVVVLVSCMDRKPPDPFVCMYVSHYNGATFRSFLGAAVFVGASADAAANQVLGSLAQDIVERYNNPNKENLRQALQSCLLMTDSKCNVPDPLQEEVGAKQLTLGQYLLKTHQ